MQNYKYIAHLKPVAQVCFTSCEVLLWVKVGNFRLTKIQEAAIDSETLINASQICMNSIDILIMIISV